MSVAIRPAPLKGRAPTARETSYEAVAARAGHLGTATAWAFTVLARPVHDGRRSTGGTAGSAMGLVLVGTAMLTDMLRDRYALVDPAEVSLLVGLTVPYCRRQMERWASLDALEKVPSGARVYYRLGGEGLRFGRPQVAPPPTP